MKSRKALLTKLLQTLVDEWGQENVAKALAGTNVSLEGRAEGPQPRSSKKSVRLSATEQIQRSALEGEQKEVLLQLAARYDQKLFLPSVADVREFLIMMGTRPIGMKDRTQAFRVLLGSLTQLPVARLRQLARTALHSGSSELGPISDAMVSACHDSGKLVIDKQLAGFVDAAGSKFLSKAEPSLQKRPPGFSLNHT